MKKYFFLYFQFFSSSFENLVNTLKASAQISLIKKIQYSWARTIHLHSIFFGFLVWVWVSVFDPNAFFLVDLEDIAVWRFDYRVWKGVSIIDDAIGEEFSSLLAFCYYWFTQIVSFIPSR